MLVTARAERKISRAAQACGFDRPVLCFLETLSAEASADIERALAAALPQNQKSLQADLYRRAFRTPGACRLGLGIYPEKPSLLLWPVETDGRRLYFPPTVMFRRSLTLDVDHDGRGFMVLNAAGEAILPR